MYEVLRAALDFEPINIRLGSACRGLVDTTHEVLKVGD